MDNIVTDQNKKNFLVKLTYVYGELETRGGEKFDKYAHTLKMLLAKGASVMGKSSSDFF